jgi:hypothetical protein
MKGDDLTQYIPLPHSRPDPKLSALQTEARVVGREYAPVPGKWYENKEEDETFRVLSVDEDNELIEIEYLDGEIEELDLDTWHELDLEPTEEPEGWSDDADEGEEDDDEDLDDDEDEDDDDDDDDDDDEDDDDEEVNENY